MVKFPNHPNRREIVGTGIATGLFGATGLSAQNSSPPKTATLNSKVTITVGGATYSYPNGPAIPAYYVGFRDDGRIVFHLGALGLAGPSAAVKPYHLGPHHVRIERDGLAVFDEAVRVHWWNSEWTFRPGPIAVTKTPAQIFAANRMFPFGDMGCKYVTVTAKPYTIMSSSSVTPYMPTTGERGDIGLITDWSAWYLLTGNAGPMLEIARAAESFPLYYRDETTRKPVDLIKYPKANCYDEPGQGWPWFDRYPRDAGNNNIVGDGMVPQQAHFCEMSYVAHLATGDLGFLEDLQYAANFCLLCDAVKSTKTAAIISGELRGIAWALRELFMASAATQDAEARGPLPQGLHPSSYFKRLLDNSLAYYSPIMNNPNAQVFRVFVGLGKFSIQQMAYMLNVLAFGVLTGHSNWTPFYLWCLGNAVALTSGKSGYPPGFGTPVWACQNKNNNGNSPHFTSWAELYDDIFTTTEPETRNPNFTQAVYDKLKADPLNGGVSFNDPTRAMTTRMNLVVADYLDKKGLARVRAVYPELDTCIVNSDRMIRSYGSVDPRASVIG